MTILFVCTGNTCRSSMSEAIFNNMYSCADLSAISCGISVMQGSRTSTNASITIKNNLNLDIKDRKAVPITSSIVSNCDIILTMTTYIKNVLIQKYPQSSKKIFTLNEYVGIEGDIIDPFGGNIDVYNKTFEALKKSISLVVHKIKEDKSIE